MENWLDLHMHSGWSSDGEFKPSVLMQKCFDAGLKTVALADHNTLQGIPEAMDSAKKLGLQYFPAVELDCMFGEQKKIFHLLGYGIHPDDVNLQKNDEFVHDQEVENSKKLIRAVHGIGFEFNDEEVLSHAKRDVIVAETIAEVVLKDPRNDDNALLAEFRPGGKKSDNPPVNFFWEFCAQGKPAYVEMNYISFEKAVNLVKNAGGAAVLAHPGANMGMNRELTEKLIATGIDGIEAFSNYHDDATKKFYSAIADEFELITTVGSDFHGSAKPAIKLGKLFSPNPEKTVEKLQAVIKSRGGIFA